MDVSSLKRVQAWLNNKLGNAEWPSASSILDHLPDALKLWEAGDLDAIVKVRLCICCAMLSRKRREESASLLGELNTPISQFLSISQHHFTNIKVSLLLRLAQMQMNG